MNYDARINTSLPAHPKTKKLLRALGAEGGWFLIRLFLWTAANRPGGNLAGMSDDDIELAIDWAGGTGVLVLALAAVGFLDGAEGLRRIHGWHEHNPWAAGAAGRSAKARWNAIKRHHGEQVADRAVPEYRGVAVLAAISIPAAGEQQRISNAPSPSPSPSPSLEEDSPNGELPPVTVVALDETPPCPHEEIVALYHEVLPQLTRVRDWTADRQRLLRKRWREKAERQDLGWWRRFFEYVNGCDFLMGRTPGRDGRPPFECDLEWLVRPNNFQKVIEGKYQAREGVV